MLAANTKRLRRIQEKLGLDPDGKLGPQTLSAIEKRLQIRTELKAESKGKLKAEPKAPSSSKKSKQTELTLTRTGIEKIIAYEVSSESYYRAKLTKPVWPGGMSGVTIGIGYDLGYASAQTFKRLWKPFLSDADLLLLANACGKKGLSAKSLIKTLASVKVPYEAAQQVFMASSLPQYANKTLKAFNGVADLEPDAQVAILSLVYNRGASMRGSTRAEMKVIRDLIPLKDYSGIGQNIRQMKRLWQGKGLDGLLARRDHEAELVERSERIYKPDELVQV